MTVSEKEDMMRAIALAVAPLADELATTRESLHDSNALLNLREDRIRALEADNAEALRQLEIARERIQHLNAGIYIVHTMRLNWGLSCPCKCHECDILFEGIRDHLPEGSELETKGECNVKNPKRVDTFAERQKIKGQTAKIGEHYICGCGNFYWLLLKNGDCVCNSCLRAQARIIVNELAPVTNRQTETGVSKDG